MFYKYVNDPTVRMLNFLVCYQWHNGPTATYTEQYSLQFEIKILNCVINLSPLHKVVKRARRKQ
jgi:hypothetical protein